MDLARRFEPGFVYVRNRYLDPELGRFFTSPDPMGYVDGPGLYAAFGNNPINFTDPLGLEVTLGFFSRMSSRTDTPAACQAYGVDS